jgi:deoxyribodipyrimidine photo-lyase
VSTTIVLFRQDLRLHDHPALTAAAQRGDVLPVFVYDEQVAGDWGFGGASQWWLHESLISLSASIASLGGHLVLRRGNTLETLIELQAASKADAIYFSRQYQPWSAELEASISAEFIKRNIEVKRYPGTLLHEPGSVLTGSGTSFKVFTPFWRAANKLPVAIPVPVN